MPFDIGGFGQNIAEGAFGAGMGLLLGEHNDRRQVRQQEKLQAIQEAGNKRMMDYSQQKQYEMWLKTNYGAQMEQLKLAGLNPGLIYGMKGGGGVTTGSPSGSVSGASASQNPGEVQQMSGMGMQLGMMAAQQKLIDAQAENLNADTENKRGVQRENIAMGTEKLFQEWQNLKQTHTLQELEATMRNIENFEKQTSQGNRLRYIQYQTDTALHNLGIVANENQISEATVADQIKQIKAEATGAILKNILTQSQTTNLNSDTWLNDYRAKDIYNRIQLGWEGLSNENKELRIKEELKDWTTDPNREAIQQAVGAINSLMHTNPNAGPKDSRTISTKSGNTTTTTTRYNK